MKDFLFPLVVPIEGEPRASSEIIARGVEQQHASVIKLIRRYASDFEQLGPLAFETRKGKALPQGGLAKATEFAMLNGAQQVRVFSLRGAHRQRGCGGAAW